MYFECRKLLRLTAVPQLEVRGLESAYRTIALVRDYDIDDDQPGRGFENRSRALLRSGRRRRLLRGLHVGIRPREGSAEKN